MEKFTIIITVLCFLTTFPIIQSVPIEFYLNGNNAQKDFVHHILLDLLNSVDVPKSVAKDIKPPNQSSAESYLFNIFMKSQDNKNKLPGYNFTSFSLTDRDYYRINQSNAIMSFTAEPLCKRWDDRIDHTLTVQFTGIPNNVNNYDQLMSAELRLFRDSTKLSSVYQKYHKFNILVYRVLPEDQFTVYPYHRINSVTIASDYHGWIALSLTQCLQYWTNNPQKHYVIKIIVVPVDEYDLRISPEAIGIAGLDDEPQKRAFMIGFYKNDEVGGTYFDLNDIIAKYDNVLHKTLDN